MNESNDQIKATSGSRDMDSHMCKGMNRHKGNREKEGRYSKANSLSMSNMAKNKSILDSRVQSSIWPFCFFEDD